MNYIIEISETQNFRDVLEEGGLEDVASVFLKVVNEEDDPTCLNKTLTMCLDGEFKNF